MASSEKNAIVIKLMPMNIQRLVRAFLTNRQIAAGRKRPTSPTLRTARATQSSPAVPPITIKKKKMTSRIVRFPRGAGRGSTYDQHAGTDHRDAEPAQEGDAFAENGGAEQCHHQVGNGRGRLHKAVIRAGEHQ